MSRPLVAARHTWRDSRHGPNTLVDLVDYMKVGHATRSWPLTRANEGGVNDGLSNAALGIQRGEESSYCSGWMDS